jgi:hypothetical protein
MVEAKPLRSDLEKARGEGFRYCWQNKVPFYAITDGNVWELHDLREMGGKEIFRIQLKSDNPGDAARQLLALWRPAMPKVKVGPPSVTTEERETETRDETQLEQSLQWLKEQVRPGQSPPTSIRFPDGKQEDLRTWKDLLIAVAKWALPKLQQQRKLPLGSLIRRDGQMRAPRDIGDGWKVETWFGARGCVRNAVRILREAEISADEVFVTPGEGQGRRGRPPKRQR